jgi:hypothetical protein
MADVDFDNVDFVNNYIKTQGVDTNRVSDSYHTFGELYDHRIQLWIALCKAKDILSFNWKPVWRTQYHSDGELAFGGGWFVLGIGKKAGEQLTYHLPMTYWNECDFAETLDKAPEWDGHTATDVLERLKNL